MARAVLFSLVLWTSLGSSWCIGQPAPPMMAGTKANSKILQAPGLEAIDSAGKRDPIDASKGYKFSVESATAGESTLDVMRRKGYEADAPTLKAVKRWNPGISSFTTQLDENKPVHLIAPINESVGSSKMVVSPDAKNLSPMVFAYHDAEIKRARIQVDGAGLADTERIQLKRAADSLARANKSFEAQAVNMTPRQRALAESQVDLATVYLRQVSAIQVPVASQRSTAIAAIGRMASSTESFSLVLSQPARRLKVVVNPTHAKQIPERMDVYVLPIGVAEYGAQTELTKIRNLLEILKFPSPTSPSDGELEPGFTYAIWIGPRNATEKMAQMVKSSAVRYKTVDTSRPSLNDISFEESEKVQSP